VRAFDVIERRFGFLAHNPPSKRPQSAADLAGLIRFHLFCHKFSERQREVRGFPDIRTKGDFTDI
jgi:hypothetical protein